MRVNARYINSTRGTASKGIFSVGENLWVGETVGLKARFFLLHISEAAPAPAPEGTSAEKPPGAEGATEKTSVTEKTSASQIKRDESRDSSLSKPSSVQRSRDRNKDPNEPQVRGSLRTIRSVRFSYHR